MLISNGRMSADHFYELFGVYYARANTADCSLKDAISTTKVYMESDISHDFLDLAASSKFEQHSGGRS